jgi:transcriptional regulator with XRE-family HTH domain
MQPEAEQAQRYPEQAKALTALRMASGKSKNQVIDESKISRPTYFDLEKGARRLIETHAKALSPVLGVAIEELVALGLREELSQTEIEAATEIGVETGVASRLLKEGRLKLDDLIYDQPFTFDCPKCGQKVTGTIRDATEGRPVTCQHCQQVINLQPSEGMPGQMAAGQKALDELQGAVDSLQDTLNKFSRRLGGR